MALNSKIKFSFFAILLLVITTSGALAGKWPWQRRIGKKVEIHHRRQYQRVTPDMWPPEPKTPSSIDHDKFKSALLTLCGQMPPKRLEKYTTEILENAAAFKIDPFLLAALVHDRSRCQPKTPENATKYGVTRIDVDMHAPHIRGGKYKYFVYNDAKWSPRVLDVKKYPFNIWKAAKLSSNLYWSAAILRVFKEQHESLDKVFSKRPHRHYVSHWFFGDNVREIEPEDRVLTGRRRLLEYYNEALPMPAGEFMGVQMVSPLDGVPRLVLDDFGNRRGKKWGPGHQGTDLTASSGEPIRAIADGKIVFAGVDLKGAGSKMLTPKDANDFPRNEMGSGGLYVAISHKKGFRTYYMHMDSIAVNDWEDVKAGQFIGTVGSTGTVQSGAHLHLEFRVAKTRVDPAVYLSSILVDPKRFAP